MDFKSYAKNSAMDILGATQKALITVTDIRDRDVSENPMKTYNTSSALNTGFSTGLAKSYVATQKMKDIADKAADLKKMASGLSDGAINSQATEEVIDRYIKQAKKMQYEVMFNPSEIRIGGYGGGKFQTTIYENNIDTNTNKRSSSILPSNAHITFSTRLIFDKTDRTKAFYSDRLSIMNSTRLVKEGINTVKNLTGMDTSDSVQQEVEAFIAALRSPDLRMVSFDWGKDVHYEGILNQLNAEYQMFDIDGQPCRAFVDMTLVCADDSIFPDSTDLFKQKYNKYWANGGTDITSAISRGIGGL